MRHWIEASSLLLLATLAAYLFIQVPNLVVGWSLMLPGTTDRSLSPSFFPRIALATLAVLSLLTGIAALRRAAAAGPVPPFDGSAAAWRTAAAFGWILCLMAYLATMRLTGFYLSSALMIFAMGYFAGYRKLIVLSATAISAPVVVELVFREVLSMGLPRGQYLDFSLGTALFG